MSIITDDYAFNTDAQLKASYQSNPTGFPTVVTQLVIKYDNQTSSDVALTITTYSGDVLETVNAVKNEITTGHPLTIFGFISVKGSGCKVRFNDDPAGHCSVATSIAATSENGYAVLDSGEYSVNFSPTTDPNYPPQYMTLTIR